MSSILRALRRLEAEARSDEADEATLHEHVVFSGGRSRGPRSALALGALVVVVVCVGALGIAGVQLLLGSGSPTSGDGPGRVTAAGSTTTRPAPARASASTPQSTARTHTLAAESPGPPRRAAALAAPPVPRVPVAAVQAPPPPTPRESTPAVRPAVPVAPAVASETRSVEVPDPIVAAGAPPPTAVEETSRASGAPVGVERILWHPSAEKRRAWLRVDGEDAVREVREGEQVGRYAVTRIDAGSVLFRSGSIELTRKLGADLP